MTSKKSLQDDINKLLENTSPVKEVISELKHKTKKLDSDPVYQAELIKADFTKMIYDAMKEQGLNKNVLAEKIGKKRQYISRVLNETANFTIETMATFACALNKKLRISFVEEKEVFKIKASTPLTLGFLKVEPDDFEAQPIHSYLKFLSFISTATTCYVVDDASSTSISDSWKTGVDKKRLNTNRLNSLNDLIGESR